MAMGRIDEVVSESSFQQLEKLVSLLGSSQALFTDNIKGAIALNNAIGGTKNFKDFTATTEKAQLAIDKLAISQAKVAQAELKLQQTRDAIAQKYEAQMARQAAMEAKQTARINEAERAYTKLSRELETARKGAQDLAAQYGVTDQRFISAAKNVIKLDDNLKLIDGKLGKYQRNVGNYASGFNGLGNSINQITREFPSFAFSVQTGFLALSNNIPIFFDEISRTRKEIALLRAEGQQVPGILAQIGASFFSLSTILSIIISLTVIYGKQIGEFFSAIFKGKEAMDSFIARQKAIGEALKGSDYKDAIKNVMELKTNIDLAKKGFIDKEKVLKQFNSTMGQSVGEVKTFNEAEKVFNANADNFIKFTLLKAAAQIAFAKASEAAASAQFKRQETPEENVTGLQKFLIFLGAAGTPNGGFDKLMKTQGEQNRNAAASELDKTVKFFQDAGKTLQEQAAKFGFDIFGGQFNDKNKKNSAEEDALELMRRLAEIRANNQKEISEDDQKSYAERIEAAEGFRDQAIKATEFANQKAKLQENLSADALKLIDANSSEERIAIYKQFAELVGKVNKDVVKNNLEALEKEDKRRAEAQADSLAKVAAYRDDTLSILNDLFNQGTIDEKEYNKRRIELQRDFTKDYINAEIKNVEELIEVNKKRGLDTYQQEKDLAALRLKLSQVTTDQQIDDLKKLADAEKYFTDLQAQFRKELFNLTVSLINARYDNEKNLVQDNIDQIDVQREKEIEAVANSLASEQEKANRLQVINAEADAKKSALERRQREIDVRKARFEKAVNIASTIESTFANIAKAAVYLASPFTAPLYPGIVALISAIGAARLAAIVATPIPRFQHGGTQKHDGLAMFGEVGTELMIEPGGKKSLTPDKPTVGFVKAGTRFISHKDLVKMSGGLGDVMYYQGEKIDIEPLIDATEKSGRRIEKAILSNRQKKTGLQYYGSQRGQEYLRKNI